MVTNKALTGIHKSTIEFFLKNIKNTIDFSAIGYDDLISQINKADIITENTPYYCIIKFSYNGESFNVYDKTIEIQVLRTNGAPVVFHMYFKDNRLYEFEYFIADLSEICEGELFDGEVLVQVH